MQNSKDDLQIGSECLEANAGELVCYRSGRQRAELLRHVAANFSALAIQAFVRIVIQLFC